MKIKPEEKITVVKIKGFKFMGTETTDAATFLKVKPKEGTSWL